jgi:hypothetical protein
MIDLKTMTIEDLRALKDEVSETLKAKRADAKASASETKDELDKLMRAELTEGSKVIFKFGKDEVEGTEVRHRHLHQGRRGDQEVQEVFRDPQDRREGREGRVGNYESSLTAGAPEMVPLFLS